jgi:4-amino-4-deoxy-L-arabinose transferase-like glycosyltransferase
MSFQLTKLAGALLMPLPLILGLLIFGLVLLYLNRARRLSLVALTSGTLLLLLLSVPLLPRQAATAIENDYPRLWMPPDASWVVVLGAGSRPDPSLSPVSRLSTNSLHRLAEGVRLYRQLPKATWRRWRHPGGCPRGPSCVLASRLIPKLKRTRWRVGSNLVS